MINPSNGWLQNCNSTPYTVAGINSPKKSDYPIYMAPDGENFRGINAVKVLVREKKYTIDKVIIAGYDTYLAFFEKLVPALINAFETLPTQDSLRLFLKQPIQVMKVWDLHSGENSVATTLAVTWGSLLMININSNNNAATFEDIVFRTNKFATNPLNDSILLVQFKTAINGLMNSYGDWNISWGSINRFQRISNSVESKFDDKQPSIPIGFTSSQWGQIPSYTSRRFDGTKNRYGVNGNSFICVVEFSKKIKARSLLAGGESGDPFSKHFTDQANMYCNGIFKEVLFYKEDVLHHAERNYHPGK
jgi:acyl-homoserine lactone acylase PvdQ